MLMKKNYLKILFLSIFCSLFCMSCDKSSLEGTIIVSAEYVEGVDPVSAIERNYMQIKNIGEGSSYWETVDYIEGFEYEEGYEYVLKVQIIKYKKPAIDMSDTKYKLIEILSKSKKSINN